MVMKKTALVSFCLLSVTLLSTAQEKTKITWVDAEAKTLEPKLIELRRYFHESPELSNQEIKTSAKVVDFLKSLGLDVQYPVAKTGVVALLKGGKPGPVVALRADMDALPITERNGLPFASKVVADFAGQQTGVMHACGHDAHMAMLLIVAEILTKHKAELKGTVKFIFQPAEEGAPANEWPAGAERMVKDGVLKNPNVDAIFGLHIQSLLPSGQIAYRAGGLMASVDGVDIKVKGKGAHGATPWDSVDPIVVAAQIIQGLQTVVSRQTELTKAGAVITIGSMHAGVRRNIIPETATLEGTIRAFDDAMQKKIHEKIKVTAEKIAESAGATAEVNIMVMYPATVNHPELTNKMVPSLIRAAGKENVVVTQPVTMAEDFSFYQREVPGFFFFLGAYPANMNLTAQPTHHTADFMIDEAAMITGVKALVNVTLDYAEGWKK